MIWVTHIPYLLESLQFAIEILPAIWVALSMSYHNHHDLPKKSRRKLTFKNEIYINF